MAATDVDPTGQIGFTVRPFTEADRAAVLALAERLTEGVAPWLEHDAVLTAARDWLAGSMDGVGPDSSVFVAVTVTDDCVGVVSVTRHRHFTGEDYAYIGELAVAAHQEGRGVGRALVAAAEHWARERGYRMVALETGAENQRARCFYARQGYGEESVRLVKILEYR